MLASTVRSVAGASRRSMSALSSLLSAKADELPARAAIVFDQGGEKKRWNLGELERHSSATANGFAEMGLVHGDVVTAWLDNSIESVVVQQACAKAGVVVGSTTVTGSPSARPAKAVAKPALPPLLETRLCAPSALAREHVSPMPRILKEPGGCHASIFKYLGPLRAWSHF